MKRTSAALLSIASALTVLAVPAAQAQTFPLIALGTLDSSRSGEFADLSGLNYKLENGVAANELGGFGSAITYVNGNTFLALPDRGPNAVPFNPLVDDTVNYINRFHTIKMELTPNTTGSGLPYTLTPELEKTTLLWSLTPLVYSNGKANGIDSGVPKQNNILQHFFTGRSDNFNPKQNSGDPNDARFDTEGMRISNNGLFIYISDEYGPYVYEFDRLLGIRLRSFTLPKSFYVTSLSAMGADEISGNTVGRVANKGMEGLAITPDGRTLVGIMQQALIQDAALGGAATKLLRIVTIDIASGKVTHQYPYELTAGSGVSEMLALNNHEFIVDERDGNGRANANNAKVKQLFKIDLAGATDISSMNGTDAASHAVPKTLFLDIVKSLTATGISAAEIPAKIEGITFGPDVKQDGKTVHTLWVANDNDFLETVPDANGNEIPNPNQFFVFSFTTADLGGSQFLPQQVQTSRW